MSNNYKSNLTNISTELESIYDIINALPDEGSGGNTDIEDAFVTRTLTTYENSRVSSIGKCAFYYCVDLTSVNFPVANYIGESAFYYCECLTSVSFPACTNIERDAFANCYGLISINFPACTSIGGAAFDNCVGLTSVSFPACTSIGGSAFYYCECLTSVSFPACTYIGANAFYECFNLTSVNFPSCTSIEIAAFDNCVGLTSVSFPSCTYIGTEAFYGCESLTSVNFPVCTNIKERAFLDCFNLTSINFPAVSHIGSMAFYGCESLTSVSFPKLGRIESCAFSFCYNLLSLYLASNAVCTLVRSNAFASTPIDGYTASTNGVYGSVYVPYSLVDAYKSATNWTYYADRITYIPGTEPRQYETIDFSTVATEKGWVNLTEIGDPTITTTTYPVQLIFSNENTETKYYTSTPHIRVYNGSTLTISTDFEQGFSSIIFHFTGSSYMGDMVCNIGELASDTTNLIAAWSGTAQSISFTTAITQTRISSIEVMFA